MEAKLPITISLVEDEQSFSNRLKDLFTGNLDIEIISDFINYTDALKGLVVNEPDVILMDIQLLGKKTGIDLVGVLRAEGLQSKIIMLTSFDDDERVFQSLKNGANGYLIKGESKDMIIQSVKEVMEGKAPMSPGIASLLIKYFNDLGNETKELNQLSVRENEILDKLSQGYLYKEVAGQLEISIETVKKHAGSIYRKLHVQNKTEAINIYKKR